LIASGALPKWFLATILLPKKASTSTLENILNDMDITAKKMKMQIVGGHTEVTPYLMSPIIIGTAIGTTDRYFTTKGAKVGDKIIMTKCAGLEGTAVLALDHKKDLIDRGIEEEIIKTAENMIYETTVYREGEILIKKFKNYIHAMHDPTEGGVYTALNEIADASNVGVKIEEEKINIRKETSIICRELNLNPYLLLSSGALIVVVMEDIAREIVKEVKNIGIEASIIGEITDKPNERILIRDKYSYKLPRQERDEIWKLY
jgi:hydrogenase maturation factor